MTHPVHWEIEVGDAEPDEAPNICMGPLAAATPDGPPLEALDDGQVIRVDDAIAADMPQDVQQGPKLRALDGPLHRQGDRQGPMGLDLGAPASVDRHRPPACLGPDGLPQFGTVAHHDSCEARIPIGLRLGLGHTRRRTGLRPHARLTCNQGK